jgi:hypothetical protein
VQKLFVISFLLAGVLFANSGPANKSDTSKKSHSSSKHHHKHHHHKKGSTATQPY